MEKRSVSDHIIVITDAVNEVCDPVSALHFACDGSDAGAGAHSGALLGDRAPAIGRVSTTRLPSST